MQEEIALLSEEPFHSRCQPIRGGLVGGADDTESRAVSQSATEGYFRSEPSCDSTGSYACRPIGATLIMICSDDLEKQIIHHSDATN